MMRRGLFGGGAMQAVTPFAQRARENMGEQEERPRGLFGGGLDRIGQAFSQDSLGQRNNAGVSRGEQLGAMLMSLAGPQQQGQAMQMLSNSRERGRDEQAAEAERRANAERQQTMAQRAVALAQELAPGDRAAVNAAMANPELFVETYLGNMEASTLSGGQTRLNPLTGQQTMAEELFREDGMYGTQGRDGIRVTGQDETVRQGLALGNDQTRASTANTQDQIRSRREGDARAAAESEGPQWEDINSFREEAEGALGDFRDIEASYQRVIDSVAEPSAAGDLALIFNYMKMLDPGSAVRETEFANAQNAGGIPDRIRAQYNALQRGERLSESQRGDFYSRAQRLYGGQRTLAGERLSQFEEQAQTRGLPSQYAIPRLSDFSERAPQQAADNSGPREGQTATNPQTGERVVYRNGQWQPLMSAGQR